MWFYLLISIIILVVHLSVLMVGYFKNSDDFWQKEIILMLFVGIGVFIVELVLYSTENYGLFLIGLILEIFYLLMNFFVVKHKLYG